MRSQQCFSVWQGRLLWRRDEEGNRIERVEPFYVAGDKEPTTML